MKLTKKNFGTILILALLIGICLYLLVLLNSQRGPLVFAIAIFALISIGLMPATFIYIMMKQDNSKEWLSKEEEKCNLIRNAVKAKNSESEKQNILELMLTNMKDLKEYYELSRRQAKNAFFLAVTLCLIGGILLVLAVSFYLLFPKNAYTLTIGALGGAIVEFIAGTALLIYKRTLQQLNHYYRSLHENERFLLIVNLATKLPEEKQTEVYMKIIDSQLSYINEENWMNMKDS